jgi:hypothetical protein
LQALFGTDIPDQLKRCVLIRQRKQTRLVVHLNTEKSWGKKIVQQIKTVHLSFHNMAYEGAYIYHIE